MLVVHEVKMNEASIIFSFKTRPQKYNKTAARRPTPNANYNRQGYDKLLDLGRGEPFAVCKHSKIKRLKAKSIT